MAAQMVIVPGTNAVLARVARHLEGNPQVKITTSANAALWHVRRAPPRVVVADTQLKDIGGSDLLDILSVLSSNLRLILCGPEDVELARAVEARGGVFISLADGGDAALRHLYASLGIAPPARPPTGPLPGAGAEPSARVTPPSAAQRLPPPPAPQRVASQGTPNEDSAARRPPTAPTQAWVPRGGSQVIQPQQMSVIQNLLATLAEETKAECVLLSDAAGMRLLEVGTAPAAFGPIVEPLLATSFSTAGQLARQLREPEARSLYMHEGVHYDIYAFNVGQRFILTLVFDKKTNPGQIGTVWVYAKRSIRQLEVTLAH